MTARRRGAWSTPERIRLRALFPRTPLVRLARLLNRSEATVLRCALELFAGEPRTGPFSADEDALLRTAWTVHDPEIVATVLRRPTAELQARVRELRAEQRCGPWNAADDRELRACHGSLPDELVALRLGRSTDDIRERAHSLRLGKDKAALRGPEPVAMPRWTSDDLQRLRQLYPDHDNLSVARALGRSVQSVTSKATRLGLTKSLAALREMGRRNVAARLRRDGD
ncbi:MAG: hypothetical protein IPM29_22535 [Planctomycetes bacterium]|nr:hypothetical protein [Planctomycetota bacterium]